MKRLLTLITPIYLLASTLPAVSLEANISIRGGIVVHLNCGDGKKTAEMAHNNNCLVHGLDSDAANITRAREHITSEGLYGRVSVSRYDDKSLPYGDNVINLLITEDLGHVSREEVMRVLTPKGVMVIDGKKMSKPWPPEIDDWPQYLNKADNNAVAMDSVVGPPTRIQWRDNPRWSRSHMGISTIVSVVTANGRMFSIEDRALPDNPFLPGRFMYVARDAFNGLTLWTRKIERWDSVEVYIKSLPTQQQRRMVATDDILYCTPVLEGPLAALDAATGELIKAYESLSPVQEVAYAQGILFVNVGERFNAAAYNQTNKKGKGGGTPGEPFNGSGFSRGYVPRTVDKKISDSYIVAIDPESGKELWRTGSLKNYTGASFAVKEGHAVYQTSEGLFCINPKTGKKIWSAESAVSNPAGHDSKTPGTMPNTVLITSEYAFALTGKGMNAYSLKDGKVLWTGAAGGNYQASPDLYYVDGVVWGGNSGRDAATGRLVRSFKQQITGPMGHDRCYRNFVTRKYYINSKTGGADFIDLETGKEYPNHWTRGACGTGVLPANGLLYSTPYSCTCSIGDMIPGMNAYSSDVDLLKTRDSSVIKRKVRLEKGPAYKSINHHASADAKAGRQPSTINHSHSDWPTYRANNFRGGMADSEVSAQLKVKWEARLPGNPTASTMAGGKVYVCVPDTHTLHALDSTSGKTVWTFVADGRIDSPPTCHKGTVLFGSRDGWLYCLRASDGELAWRFKDLPDRLIGAYGQLESAWPISGAVLVEDDRVYASAGRSTYLDGGIFLYCLDPVTGKLLNSRSAHGPFEKESGFPIAVKSTGIAGGGGRKGKKGVKKEPPRMPGFRNGILVSDGTGIYIRHAAFDKELADRQTTDKRIMPLGGFIDRRQQHRTDFIFSNRFQWWNNSGGGDIMISDGKEFYAVAGFGAGGNHSYFDPRTSSYTLRGSGLNVALPINGRALAKAGDVIFVAGEPMKFKAPTWQDYEAAYSGELGGKLVAVSDGKVTATYELPSPVVWDSIAIADGQLYISLTDGTIQCMGE